MNSKKRIFFLLISFLLGQFIPLSIQHIPFFASFDGLAIIGDGLRSLSLSGGIGNLFAWAIVLLLSVLPIGYQVYRETTGRHMAIDWLLPIASIQILSFFFYLVNPTFLSHVTGLELLSLFPYLSLVTLLGTIITYILLRMILNIRTISRTQLLRTFRRLLYLSAILLIFLYTFSSFTALMAEIQVIQDGNTYGSGRTVFTLCILSALNLIPAILSALTLLWAHDFVDVLEGDPFGDESATLCQTIAVRCSYVAVLSLLISLGSNLFQLLQFSTLLDINISIQIPLMPLLLSVCLLVLCRYLQQGNALQNDNQSFI